MNCKNCGHELYSEKEHKFPIQHNGKNCCSATVTRNGLNYHCLCSKPKPQKEQKKCKNCGCELVESHSSFKENFGKVFQVRHKIGHNLNCDCKNPEPEKSAKEKEAVK